MYLDIRDLQDFYAGERGQLVRRLLVHRLRRLWPDTRGLAILGIGYAVPFLDVLREESSTVFAFMPASQGVAHWPPAGRNAAALVNAPDLPLGDASVDRILVAHCLEVSPHAGELLREAWRVLAPGGRIVVLAPNRRGLWARFEHTPFGSGRPYSRSQLTRQLRDAMFTPVGWEEALWVPPVGGRFVLRSAAAWERAGTVIRAMPAGVLLVEAEKMAHAAVRAKPERARLLERAGIPAAAAARGL